MKYTRRQLIKAMQQANKEYLSDVDNYDPITTTEDCAEKQIDEILKFIE